MRMGKLPFSKTFTRSYTPDSLTFLSTGCTSHDVTLHRSSQQYFVYSNRTHPRRPSGFVRNPYCPGSSVLEIPRPPEQRQQQLKSTRALNAPPLGSTSLPAPLLSLCCCLSKSLGAISFSARKQADWVGWDALTSRACCVSTIWECWVFQSPFISSRVFVLLSL